MGHSKGSPERKIYTMSAYIKKTKRSEINDLMIHLKIIEKQEQANLKTNRRKEIIKIRAERKSWFFEKINKIDRPPGKPD
jgi:hypothetical protein